MVETAAYANCPRSPSAPASAPIEDLAAQVTQAVETLPAACAPIEPMTDQKLLQALDQLCEMRHSSDEVQDVRDNVAYDLANASNSRMRRQALLKREILGRMTDLQLTVFLAYTGSCYEQINHRLRTANTRPLTPTETMLFEKIREAFEQLPRYQGTVYRGASLPEAVAQTYRNSSEVVERAFTSSSTSRETATSFRGRGQMMEIRSRTGRSVQSLSDEEGEILFLPGTTFEVVRRSPAVAGSDESEGAPETFYLRERAPRESTVFWDMGLTEPQLSHLWRQVRPGTQGIRRRCVRTIGGRIHWTPEERACVREAIGPLISTHAARLLPLGDSPESCTSQRLARLRVEDRLLDQTETEIQRLIERSPSELALREVTQDIQRRIDAQNLIFALWMDEETSSEGLQEIVNEAIASAKQRHPSSEIDWNAIQTSTTAEFTNAIESGTLVARFLNREAASALTQIRSRIDRVTTRCEREVTAPGYVPLSREQLREYSAAWAHSMLTNQVHQCISRHFEQVRDQALRQAERRIQALSIENQDARAALTTTLNREIVRHLADSILSGTRRRGLEAELYQYSLFAANDLPALRQRYAVSSNDPEARAKEAHCRQTLERDRAPLLQVPAIRRHAPYLNFANIIHSVCAPRASP